MAEDIGKPKKIMVKVKKSVGVDPVIGKEKLSKSEIINKKGGSDGYKSDLKGNVNYVQHGVRDKDNNEGSYIYYRDPKEKDFNVDNDRDFVRKENLASANQTNKMREYNTKNKRY